MEAHHFENDALSDYGSDFDADGEAIINELLKDVGNIVPHATVTITEDNDRSKDTHSWHLQGRLRLSRFPTGTWLQKPAIIGSGETDGLTSVSENVQTTRRRPSESAIVSVELKSDLKVPKQEHEHDQPDTRTPLQRFRTKPKKTLSVTDLVSPSWCELQYWYSLTKHGKKRSTPAMRQGSAVHKALEDQVHRTVEVDVRRKEDAWGLRLWNIIQGLRGLRETGLTRELEIWGVLEGEVVNGIIDEVSFRCPDEDMENRAATRGTMKEEQLPTDQMSINSFFKPKRDQEAEKASSSIHAPLSGDRKIYLTDIKTRSLKSLPTGASFRPTAMQVMLYHILLSDLASDRVNSDVIFDRYNLQPDGDFSDAFLASILNLSELTHDISDGSTPAQDSTPGILDHKTLRQLWAVMIQEFKETLPNGAKSIGQVLRAEYRGQDDGEVLGEKHFLFDREAIGQYLQDEMKWWKGERAAQGVCIEEAYKCRSCEFADDCEWRKQKVDEAMEAHRRRSRSDI